MRTIHIAAALILRGSDETLLVRKHGTAVFMQPGGKIEDGERAGAALLRELKEEIGLVVEPERLLYFGHFEAMAANEPGHRVVAEVFRLETSVGNPQPTAEIEEIRWVSVHSPGIVAMAPLTADHILPAYRKLLAEDGAWATGIARGS